MSYFNDGFALEQPEPDAYGRTGERHECWACNGKGLDYGETCLLCGGFGWVRETSQEDAISELRQIAEGSCDKPTYGKCYRASCMRRGGYLPHPQVQMIGGELAARATCLAWEFLKLTNPRRQPND